MCLHGGAVFVLVPAGQSPWLGPRRAWLAVFRVVSCFAAPVVCASVPQCGCRRPGWPGLVARRPLAWRSGSLGPLLSSLPQVFCDLVPSCCTSLKLMPLDITCTQVVCPDAGTPCALPWVTRDLVSWSMIFSRVMRAGGFRVCSGFGAPRTARRAGLGVTLLCLPAGAGGLVGSVC